MKLTFARNSLFGTRERKSMPPSLVALAQLGLLRWGGQDPAALTRGGYWRNAVAYRCVRLIAESAASIPLKTASPELAKLIARPSPDDSAVQFLERLYAVLQLTRNAYAEQIIFEDNNAPCAMFVLRAQRMKAITDSHGWFSVWEYRVGNRARQIPREDVLHLKLYNPEDDIYGLSPLSEVSYRKAGFTAEFVSLKADLERPVGRVRSGDVRGAQRRWRHWFRERQGHPCCAFRR